MSFSQPFYGSSDYYGYASNYVTNATSVIQWFDQAQPHPVAQRVKPPKEETAVEWLRRRTVEITEVAA